MTKSKSKLSIETHSLMLPPLESKKILGLGNTEILQFQVLFYLFIFKLQLTYSIILVLDVQHSY